MTEALKPVAKKFYDLKNKIAAKIVDLVSGFDPEDEHSYLDEGKQAKLMALYSLIEDDEKFINWIERDVRELRKAIREADETEDYLSVEAMRIRQEIDRDILSDVFIEALETEEI